MQLQASQVSVPSTAEDDPRVGQLMRRGNLEQIDAITRIALIGFPSDEGVRLNGGRAGAAQAPERIRHWLYRMTPDARYRAQHMAVLQSCLDLGNLPCHSALADNQQSLGTWVGELIRLGLTPIILGGGHETSFGHFLGYVAEHKPVAILNLDAHTDVRPLVEGQPHSGSPFRQALEHPSGLCRRYSVMGLNPHAVSAEHVEYVHRRRGGCLWKQDVDLAAIQNEIERSGDCLLITCDMDAVDQSDAPGVSAPNADGMSAALWLEAALLFGKNDRVRSFDIVEVNPATDVAESTARLAALTVWNFLLGISQREPR